MGSIPSSLLTIDRKLRVASANRNFLHKAKRSKSETIGSRIYEVFVPSVLAYIELPNLDGTDLAPQRDGRGKVR